jgi:hypothetical protein
MISRFAIAEVATMNVPAGLAIALELPPQIDFTASLACL